MSESGQPPAAVTVTSCNGLAAPAVPPGKTSLDGVACAGGGRGRDSRDRYRRHTTRVACEARAGRPIGRAATAAATTTVAATTTAAAAHPDLTETACRERRCRSRRASFGPSPKDLTGIDNPELRALVAKYGTRPPVLDPCGAQDWSILDQRMRYISHLFRAYH